MDDEIAKAIQALQATHVGQAKASPAKAKGSRAKAKAGQVGQATQAIEAKKSMQAKQACDRQRRYVLRAHFLPCCLKLFLPTSRRSPFESSVEGGRGGMVFIRATLTVAYAFQIELVLVHSY
jgi:hypothetical protein